MLSWCFGDLIGTTSIKEVTYFNTYLLRVFNRPEMVVVTLKRVNNNVFNKWNKYLLII